jgi:hypothetical protein
MELLLQGPLPTSFELEYVGVFGGKRFADRSLRRGNVAFAEILAGDVKCTFRSRYFASS